VATTDETGAPLCLLHAALELGCRDGQQGATFELLEVIGAFIAETGLAHPDDAIHAFCEAIGEGEARRETLSLRPVPTFDENLAALTALTAADRRGEER
jgi:hypothetical protein